MQAVPGGAGHTVHWAAFMGFHLSNRTTAGLVLVAIACTPRPDDNPRPPAKEAQLTPKQDCERVMNAALPFAERMLQEHGEFFPYAAAMEPAGTIVDVAASMDSEHPPSEAVLAKLVAALHAGATRGQYSAIAIVHDVRLTPPAPGFVDAIHVGLEHRSGYAVDLLVPYRRTESGRLETGEIIGTARVPQVFTANQ